MTKREILRSLHGLIAEWGLQEFEDELDAVTVAPVDEDGEYCGWNVVDALLIEFEDRGKNYIITVTDE